MPERETRRLIGRVSRAYAILLRGSDKFAQAETPNFVEAPESPLTDPKFAGEWRDYWARELRGIFSGEEGREAAVILSLATQYIVVHGTETRSERVEYGVDRFGPYKRLTIKKRRFHRTPPPEVVRISFEELVASAYGSSDAYQAVICLMDATLDALMKVP